MGGLYGLRLLHIFQNPITDFSIRNCLADHFNESLRLQPSGLEPPAIKALAEVLLVIGMQLARSMQSNLVNKPRQVHPAAHYLARTSRIDIAVHYSTALPCVMFEARLSSVASQF